MERNELASAYMKEYDDTNVTIVDCDINDGIVTFDLSDGTHWLGDNNGNYQVSKSLVGCTIVYDDNEGYLRIGRNGHKYPIDWV